MVLNLTDLVLAAYPLMRTSQLLGGRPKRDELLHWTTWWFLWACLLAVDAFTFGLLPLMDLIKGILLLPNYTAQGAALTTKLLATTKRHVATHPLCKAMAHSYLWSRAKLVEWWVFLQSEPELAPEPEPEDKSWLRKLWLFPRD